MVEAEGAQMRTGPLFSGYGGLDLAIHEVLGAETAWVSDIDKGAATVLAHRFPDVPNLGDITAIDWSTVEPVDIIAGGFPCQDISSAGKGAGMRPGTRSGLWSHMAYAISQLRPRLVVIENVRALTSASAHSDVEPCAWCVGDSPDGVMRALGAVLADLADIGYDATWHGLRAADIGAPHGRFRVFVVAYPYGQQSQGVGALPRLGRRSDSRGDLQLLPTPVVNDMGDGKTLEWWDDTDRMKVGHGNGNGHGASLAIEAMRLLPTLRTENNENRQSESHAGTRGNFHGLLTGAVQWGDYADAIHRWETITRPAPPPTTPGKNGPRLNPAFSEWMMGVPAGWFTDIPGISRTQALKLAGNGVVPQQAAQALRIILAHIAETRTAA